MFMRRLKSCIAKVPFSPPCGMQRIRRNQRDFSNTGLRSGAANCGMSEILKSCGRGGSPTMRTEKSRSQGLTRRRCRRTGGRLVPNRKPVPPLLRWDDSSHCCHGCSLLRSGRPYLRPRHRGRRPVRPGSSRLKSSGTLVARPGRAWIRGHGCRPRRALHEVGAPGDDPLAGSIYFQCPDPDRAAAGPASRAARGPFSRRGRPSGGPPRRRGALSGPPTMSGTPA